MSNPSAARMRIGAATLYVAIVLGLIALADSGVRETDLMWLIASLCLGWVTRSPWFALVPLIAVPIAVPFGYPDEWSQSWGHDPLPLWFGILVAVPVLAALVLAGVGGRRLFERSRAARRQDRL